MKWYVTQVIVEDDWTLRVQFADGTVGRIQFEPDFFTGVFEALHDPDVFRQVFIDHGAVGWPGDLDLAPDAMYAEIKRHGEWRLTGAKRDVPA